MARLGRSVGVWGWAITRGSRLVIGTMLTGVGLIARGPLELSNLGDILLLGAVIILARDVFGPAFRYLRIRIISIELLVSIAVAGALAIGEYWEAAAVLVLFCGGAYLEARVIGRVRQAVTRLLDLAPVRASVMRDGQVVDVAPEMVTVGETVLVRPGARIAVDGEVVDGTSTVDESAITGEARPVDKEIGQRVYAGTVNQDGALYVRAIGVGSDTTLARIVERIEEAQETRAPSQRLIERFARWYTPLIIGLSALAFLATGDVRLALTFLVIGCPGALVLSTPIAIMAGIGRAAQRGILIKGGESLETVGKLSAVAFDKTGTLTEGAPRVTDLIVVRNPPPLPIQVSHADGIAPVTDDDRVLTWAAVAESGSNHPLARAIRTAAGAVRMPEGTVRSASGVGSGTRVVVDGRDVAVGSPTFVGVASDHAIAGPLAGLRQKGEIAVVVAVEGAVVGALGIADVPRSNAADAVRRLRGTGIRRIAMLTGDDVTVAARIARAVGIHEVHASLLPDDKLQFIRQLRGSGDVVAMVGDGINDTPALAAADVGVAMGVAGSDVAIETADVTLMTDDLNRFVDAVRLARATTRVIRENVAVSLAVVAALLLGVALGQVGMAGGMLVHELSVLVVAANAARLLHA